jgi:type I restriction enzyme, S subunit
MMLGTLAPLDRGIGRLSPLPETWKVLTIQELLETGYLIGHGDGNHGELYPRADEFADAGVPYITANNLIHGHVDLRTCAFLSPERAQRFRKGIAQDGDVLFAHNATVGPAAVLHINQGFVVLSTTATYFRCSPDRLWNYYLKTFFESPLFRQQLYRVMGQSTRDQVPITTQRKLRIVIPPLAEQRKIARTIEAWDRAIHQVNGLLRTRRHLKRGLIQRLLTGESRFPEFRSTTNPRATPLGQLPKDWPIMKLRELTSRVTRTNQVGETLALTCSGELGLIDQRAFFTKSVASESLEDYYLLLRGEFAYNRSSMKGYPYGAIKRLDRYPRGVLSTLNICFAVSEEQLNPDFATHLFESGLLNRQLGQIAHVGARAHGLLNVSKGDFFDLYVPVPPLEEQARIAAALDAADRELRLLRELKDMYTAQKRGLMQKLLTGQVRVNV